MISPTSGVLTEETWPALLPVKSQGFTTTETIKKEDESAKKLDKTMLPRPSHLTNQSSVRRLRSETHARARGSLSTSTRLPSLEASFNNMSLSPVAARDAMASAKVFAAAKEQPSVGRKFLPNMQLNIESTTILPDPFRKKSSARNSGAFASSNVNLAGTLGPIRSAPRSMQNESGRNFSDLKSTQSRDATDFTAVSPYDRASSAMSAMSPFSTSDVGSEEVQINASAVSQRPSFLPVSKTRYSNKPPAILMPVSEKIEAEWKDAIQTVEEGHSRPDDGEVSDLASLEEFEDSKLRGYNAKQLSMRYGPLLQVSGDADRVLLGIGSNGESEEDQLKVVKRRSSLPAGLLRRGSVIKDSVRKSMFGVPRSFTGSFIAAVGSEDEIANVDKGKGKAVLEDNEHASTELTSFADALPTKSLISKVDDLNKFVDETATDQERPDSWLLRSESLPAELIDTGSDDEEWIPPLHPSANAKTSSEPIHNISSSPPPFPAPNNTPAQAEFSSPIQAPGNIHRSRADSATIQNLNTALQATKALKTPKSAARRFFKMLSYKKSTASKIPTRPTISTPITVYSSRVISGVPSIRPANNVTTATAATTIGDSTAIAHRILDLARAETHNPAKRDHMIAIGEALVTSISEAKNARTAGEQAQQASIRAERAAMQCEQAVERVDGLVKAIMKHFE